MSGIEPGYVEVYPELCSNRVAALHLGWQESVCQHQLVYVAGQSGAHIVQLGSSVWALGWVGDWGK